MRRLPLHPSAQLAWGIASMEASYADSQTIRPVHFLSAILKIVDGVHLRDAELLGFDRTDLEAVDAITPQTKSFLGLTDGEITQARRRLRQPWAGNPHPARLRMLHRTQASRNLFSQAATLAVIKGDTSLTMTHLMGELLRNLPEEATDIFSGPMSTGAQAGPADQMAQLDLQDETAQMSRRGPQASKTPAIDAIGRNLTELAREHRLPQIVGRHDEMLTVARHLIRTSKRNVLLIGDAGVGKTALAEGLAQHLLTEDVVKELSSLRIVEISVTDLIAGTRYRGDMEERARRVMDEAKDDQDLVLFIDEFYQVAGAGASVDSGVDLGTIMKPALARGKIRCIGATTTEEYEKYLKGDRALLRRFQIVRVDEPSSDEALLICKAWADRIEQAQGVMFDEDAIQAAVELASKHILSRSLPDSAIDLLENAATFVKLPSFSAKIRPPQKGPVNIRREHVIGLLEQHYGVVLEGSEALDLELLRRALENKLVGQDRAIEALLDSLDLAANRDTRDDSPLGVLMFVGPTGVGKTYSAELIGNALADGGFARFNMNEFKEKHEISRLIGAPPGFVGHDQPGAIFLHVESNPRAVILFDEMEKAHPEVQDYFLQVFDKGEARDTHGRVADFRNQLFVMTCNIGVASASEREIGFRGADVKNTVGDDRSVRSRLRGYFRDEFLGRVDAVIVFATLQEADFEALFDRSFGRLQTELAEHSEVSVEAADNVRVELAGRAAALEEGVRGFDRLFREWIEQPLMEFLRDNGAVQITLRWLDGEVKILADQPA